MEPRPQRPRSAPPQRTGQMPAQQQPPEGPYDDNDQPYIAPPRTEYDYSPLDLAPSGQRRKRQFVAGAIGVLMIVLVSAVAVLAFLLINNDDGDDGVDLAARSTENAATRAVLDAESTQIQEAVTNADSTATAQNGGAPTEAAGDGAATEASTEASSEDSPTEDAAAPTDAPADGETAGAGDDPTTEAGGETAAGPDVSQLEAMLPPADAIPAGLDAESETNLDQAAVVTALGDSRTAAQNLERWGWSGNVGRSWTPSDPAVLESDTVTGLFVSVHGFNSPESSQEALGFFADVLASGEGQTEGDPPLLGDGSRLLTSTAEDGTVTVALYVVQGNVLYRFGATGSDPEADLIALAETTLAGAAGE